MPTKTQELTQALIAALDASPVSRDEKNKALGEARSYNNRVFVQAQGRVYRGPVGTGKHTEALRTTMSEMAAQSKKSKGKKDRK